ncbi:MAG: nucleotide exchange factor GrpE [Akkermansiaceae bacterium]
MQDPLESQDEAQTEDIPTPESQEETPQESAEEAAETIDDSEPEVELTTEEALEIEVAKWKDQAVRNAAELENFRKRMSREKLDAVRYGNQGLLEELLPVLDNFDMGMQAAAQEEGSMLYMGMSMVQKQIGEFFTSQNVEVIPAEPGGDFDPNLHEAISQEASSEIKEGQIIRVVRKGYRIGERLLRPSNVTVSLGESTPEEQD